jgi:hypothetical protein
MRLLQTDRKPRATGHDGSSERPNATRLWPAALAAATIALVGLVANVAVRNERRSDDRASVRSATDRQPGQARSPSTAEVDDRVSRSEQTNSSCRNSYDKECGEFRWDPSPQPNDPMDIEIVVSPEAPSVGEAVTFVIHVRDDASGRRPIWIRKTYGDGITAVTHLSGTTVCRERYGPWTPPQKGQYDITERFEHKYRTAGRYTAEFEYSTSAGSCYDPYASVGRKSVTVEVT